MSIIFSEHAKQQLKRRRISRKRAIKTIRKPENRIETFKSRNLQQRRFGDKILEVVTKTEGSGITVVTGYYLKKIL